MPRDKPKRRAVDYNSPTIRGPYLTLSEPQWGELLELYHSLRQTYGRHAFTKLKEEYYNWHAIHERTLSRRYQDWIRSLPSAPVLQTRGVKFRFTREQESLLEGIVRIFFTGAGTTVTPRLIQEMAMSLWADEHPGDSSFHASLHWVYGFADRHNISFVDPSKRPGKKDVDQALFAENRLKVQALIRRVCLRKRVLYGRFCLSCF